MAVDLFSVHAEDQKESVHHPRTGAELDLSAAGDRHETGTGEPSSASTPSGLAGHLQMQAKQPGLSPGDRDTACSPVSSMHAVAQPDEMPPPVSRTYSTSSSTSSIVSQSPAVADQASAELAVSRSSSFGNDEMLVPAPEVVLSAIHVGSDDMSNNEQADIVFATDALFGKDRTTSAATGAPVAATDRLPPVTNATVIPADALVPAVQDMTSDTAEELADASDTPPAVPPVTATCRNAMQSIFTRASKLSQASPGATAAPHASSNADAKQPGEVSACRLHCTSPTAIA